MAEGDDRVQTEAEAALAAVSKIIGRAFPTPSAFQSYVLESLMRLLKDNMETIRISRDTISRQHRQIANLQTDLRKTRHGSDDHHS